MRLPNAERAEVDIRKLRDYCLDRTHPRGRHKARVFKAALGLTEDDAEALREAILSAAITADAQLTGLDDFGARYAADLAMMGPDGPRTISTAWIVRTGEDFARLVSCHVRT